MNNQRMLLYAKTGIRTGLSETERLLADAIFGGRPVPPPPPEIEVYPILTTSEHPIKKTEGGIDYFAVVTDSELYGYWDGEHFSEVEGMTGDVIRRVEYVSGNNDAYCTTDYYLTGDDTLKIKYRVSAASNIGGCFVGSSANNNFCLYASNTSTGWYMRYDGGNDRSFPGTSAWVDMQATPTGFTANGTAGSWGSKTFTSTAPMYIGHLYQSTSPKIKGDIAWFEVEGKHRYLPVIVGEEYRMFDVLAWEFPNQVGVWSGGEIIEEEIIFPV